MLKPHEMPHPDDPERILPEPHHAWEPAGPRKRLPVPTKRPVNFRDPDAPHISVRKRRRNVIKAAIEATITSDKTDSAIRAAARRFMRQLHEIERQRPDSVLMGMVGVGGDRVSIWAYEPELAPIERAPEVILKWNASLRRAWHTLRSM